MFRSSNFPILTLTVSLYLMQLWYHGVTATSNGHAIRLVERMLSFASEYELQP